MNEPKGVNVRDCSTVYDPQRTEAWQALRFYMSLNMLIRCLQAKSRK